MKKEVGLVIPAKFKWMVKKQKFAKVLHQELVMKENKFNLLKINIMGFENKRKVADFSTWENCTPWHYDDNSIQSTSILGDAVENFLTLKLLLFTPGHFKRLT